MQLDKTAIVISQRSAVDLIDLSLVVMRRFWKPILFFAVLGIAPFALLNLVLLWPLTRYETLLIASSNVNSSAWYHFRYLFAVTAAIFIQAPLALSGVTYFIGQAVFIERPSTRQVLLALWHRSGAMLFVLGLLRMSVLCFVPLLFMYSAPVFAPEIEIPLYAMLMCGSVYLIRGFRPFSAEILLLERCPFFKSKKNPERLAYGQRSRWLHSTLYNELFGVHIGVSTVVVLTATSATLGILFLIGVLTGITRWGWWIDIAIYPMILWFLCVWVTVIRFLIYMNSRIRTEGWEIELRLKAEAQRLEEMAR